MYTKSKDKNVPNMCTQSTGMNVHRQSPRIRMYTEYKHMMIYDTESPQPYPYAIPLPVI